MAALDLSLANLAGLTAGALIFGVGVFVLVAKPRSGLHQLFFLLALMDGASTLLFGLAAMSADARISAYFEATYWYHFVAFVALLAIFGLAFPAWRGRRAVLRSSVGLVAVSAAGVLAAYVLDREVLWATDGGGIVVAPLGNAVNVVFVATIALLGLRLTRVVLREPSPSHRRQGAYVLGGMMLAFAPYPATLAFQALTRVGTTYLSPRLDGAFAYWAFAAVTVALAASAWMLARAPREHARKERRFVLACYGGVLALALVALAFRAVEVSRVLRTLALLAYPLLLGFAIVRYEVFDIDRKLRRAATVTLVSVALTVGFILAENAVEGMLQDNLAGAVSSQFVAGSVAAILAGLAFVPVLKASRKVSARILPELSRDELHERKLEIYRHSLAGAYADGIVREGESRTLKALRESLGITQAEHEMLIRDVVPA